jgi:Tol biopolymer transport system component
MPGGRWSGGLVSALGDRSDLAQGCSSLTNSREDATRRAPETLTCCALAELLRHLGEATVLRHCRALDVAEIPPALWMKKDTPRLSCTVPRPGRSGSGSVTWRRRTIIGVDERLRRELSPSAFADPSGPYDRVVEKKVRARIVRRLQAAALAVTVVVGTGAGVYGLARLFPAEPATQLGGAVANGRIAFSSYEVEPPGMPQGFSGWRIYTMEPNGSDVRLIGPHRVDEALYPTWSPDASWIAFVGRVAELEKPGIYVIDADGGGLTEIFSIEGHRQIDSLEWSPDGSRLGFVYTEFTPAEPPPEAGARAFDRSSTIWTVAADGSDATAVTTLGRETGLSWSPDGSRIVFARSPLVTEDRGDQRNGLWIVDADGRNERQITQGDDHSGPAWSPDGRTIVFDEAATGGTGVDLYAVDTDGGNPRRLTADDGNEYGAVWSADGTQIAYATREADPAYDESVCHIRVMNPDGSNVRSLIAAPGSEGCPGQLGISWAPAAKPMSTATESEKPEMSTRSEPGGDGRPAWGPSGLRAGPSAATVVRGRWVQPRSPRLFRHRRPRPGADVGFCESGSAGVRALARPRDDVAAGARDARGRRRAGPRGGQASVRTGRPDLRREEPLLGRLGADRNLRHGWVSRGRQCLWEDVASSGRLTSRDGRS